MNKLIEEGLEFIGISRIGIKIKFLTQSCFPIYLVQTNNKDIAVKIVDKKDMAESEAYSLSYLNQKKCTVPLLYGFFSKESKSLLYMEYITNANNGNKKEQLLSTLKALYSNINGKWGFTQNNYIGQLPQKNKEFEDFETFFLEDRILPQLKLCLDNKLLTLEFINRIEKFVSSYIQKWNLGKSKPRLIHGDLWNGNVLFADKAYLIDPSISYAHPEQDLAMLELFGSPLTISDMEKFITSLGYDSNFSERILFWQLYPVLVHVNLFGGSYLNQLNRLIQSYH